MNENPQVPSNLEFFRAVEKNDISTVRKLVDGGCDINIQDKGGSTPLMRASLHGYMEIVSILIQGRADLEMHDKIGKTALHYAAQEQYDDVIGELLDAGADANSQDIHGNSPLGDAVFYSQGKGAAIKRLRQNGANDHLPNKQGVTPLELAKNIANFDIAQHFR